MNKQKKMVMSAAHTHALFDLESLLAEIRSRRLALLLDERNRVEIWTPNTKVPMTLRRSVFKHNDVLQQLITQWDKTVCPSPELHSRHWRTNTGVCRICRRLDKSMSHCIVEDIAA